MDEKGLIVLLVIFLVWTVGFFVYTVYRLYQLENKLKKATIEKMAFKNRLNIAYQTLIYYPEASNEFIQLRVKFLIDLVEKPD